MRSESSKSAAGSGFPVFAVACWVLGLMALSQLWIGGMALAKRLQEAQQVRVIEREVLREVMVEVPAKSSPGLAVRPSPRPDVPPLRELPPQVNAPSPESVAPTPLSVPSVADPKSERLLAEAREARVAGDMGRAIVKLEQAIEESPDDPNILYELGLVHEQMGVFDKAAEYFQRVFAMGMTRAGSLYEMAAAKLRDGFAQPEDMLGRLSLGRVRIFKNPDQQQGQQVILTIPVQKAPDEEIDVSGIEVQVRFFNRTGGGQIVELDDPDWVQSRWATLPFDWIGGEESLRMTYTIPKMNPQMEHLFGSRSHYGQVVTLVYQGQVLDVQAWPRDLAAKGVKSLGPGELLPPEFEDSLPPDFDPTLPLLPALPE